MQVHLSLNIVLYIQFLKIHTDAEQDGIESISNMLEPDTEISESPSVLTAKRDAGTSCNI